jgi:hypothetical protein
MTARLVAATMKAAARAAARAAKLKPDDVEITG